MLRVFSWLGRHLAFITLASLGAGAALLIYSNIGRAGITDGDADAPISTAQGIDSDDTIHSDKYYHCW